LQGIIRQRFHAVDPGHIFERNVGPFGNASHFLHVLREAILSEWDVFASLDPGAPSRVNSRCT
jgi:hypothetical protein